MALIRLQKYLADHGVASRRKCEEYIAEGLVKVNGKVVREMGVKVDPEKDTIETDAELVIKQQDFVYIALYKPTGYVTSVTGPEKPKVMELLKTVKERVFPVGRLDKDSSGLLLFTNDGRFAYHLTHPKFEKEKEYEVSVAADVPEGVLKKMATGVKILGEMTKAAHIKRIAPNAFRIVLQEGKNRQIRRMCRKLGLKVSALKRIRIGGLWLRKLKPGEWRYVDKKDLGALFGYT